MKFKIDFRGRALLKRGTISAHTLKYQMILRLPQSIFTYSSLPKLDLQKIVAGPPKRKGSSPEKPHSVAAIIDTQMVATRSQEPLVANDGLDDTVTANGTPREGPKRKKDDDGGFSKAEEARKRRKTAADFLDDTSEEKRISKDTPDSTKGWRQSLIPTSTHRSSEEPNNPQLGIRGNPDSSTPSTTDDISLDPEQRRPLSVNEIDNMASKLNVAVIVDPHQRQPEIDKNICTSLSEGPEVLSEPSQLSHALDGFPSPRTSQANVLSQLKSTHQRFNSVEPELPTITRQPYPIDINTGKQSDGNESDSDAAPEITTLFAATAEAQASRSLAADASRRQQDQKRQRMREREESRKLQVQEQKTKALKKLKKQQKRNDLAIATEATIQSTSQSPPLTASTTLKGSPEYDKFGPYKKKIEIPKVLPMDILSSVPAVRPPTPLPDTISSQAVNGKTPQRKHSILVPRIKRPKDVIREGKIVRILEGNEVKMTLAPKANQESRMIRERWLSGRGAIERRPWGGAAKSFVRAQ